MSSLESYVRESNRIENIRRKPTPEEVSAHKKFLELPELTVADVNLLVAICTKGYGKLREQPGMDVYVGGHVPPKGGPAIKPALEGILQTANEGFVSPWGVHIEYEKLHAYLDGNGRSGRAIWAWMRQQNGTSPFVLGFLHASYYEALEHSQLHSN